MKAGKPHSVQCVSMPGLLFKHLLVLLHRFVGLMCCKTGVSASNQGVEFFHAVGERKDRLKSARSCIRTLCDH